MKLTSLRKLEIIYQLYNNFQLQFQTDYKMAYPYYYPYFSARNVLPSSSSKMQAEISALRKEQLLNQQAEIELAILKKQEQLNTNRIHQYEQELRSKQNLSDLLEKQRIQVEINASKWRQKVYQQQLLDLKEQQYVKNMNKLNFQMHQLQKQTTGNRSYDKKNEIYQNQSFNDRVVKEYQQELLRKIQKNQETVRKSNKNQQINRNLSHQQTKSNKFDQKNIEKKCSMKQDNKVPNKRSISFSNPIIRDEINRSNIQESNPFSTLETKKQFTHKKQDNVKESTRRKFCSTKNQITQRASKRSVKISTKQNGKKNASQIKFLLNDSFNICALKKIQNRLKLASIVYKDAKCKNGRHQIDHLFNTYEGELRQRKEVKDKINNHPSVLKKHNLVVSSR